MTNLEALQLLDAMAQLAHAPRADHVRSQEAARLLKELVDSAEQVEDDGWSAPVERRDEPSTTD